MKSEELKEWFDEGKKIRFVYKDGSELYISREIFNRSFGCIIQIPKSVVLNDFIKRYE